MIDAQTRHVPPTDEPWELVRVGLNHDFPAPVRRATAFADMAMRAMQNGDLERATEAIVFLKSASVAMDQMIPYYRQLAEHQSRPQPDTDFTAGDILAPLATCLGLAPSLAHSRKRVFKAII